MIKRTTSVYFKGKSKNRITTSIFCFLILFGFSLSAQEKHRKNSIDSLQSYFNFKDRVKERIGFGWNLDYSIIGQTRVVNPYETENYVSNGEIDLIANYDYALKNENWGKGKFLIYYMIVHPIAGLTTAGFGELNGNITAINDSDPIELLRQFWYGHEFFKERLSVMVGITEPILSFAVNRFAFNDRDKFMMVPFSNIPSKDRIGSDWGGLISFKIFPWLSIGGGLNELTEERKYYSFSNATFEFNLPKLGKGIYRFNFVTTDGEGDNKASNGYVISLDQDLGKSWGLFFRFDDTEFQTLTSTLNRSLSFGLFNRQPFKRKGDQFGLGVFQIKSSQGGNFQEWGVETFYKVGLTRWCYFTADMQIFQASKAVKDTTVVTLGGRIMFDF